MGGFEETCPCAESSFPKSRRDAGRPAHFLLSGSHSPICTAVTPEPCHTSHSLTSQRMSHFFSGHPWASVWTLGPLPPVLQKKQTPPWQTHQQKQQKGWELGPCLTSALQIFLLCILLAEFKSCPGHCLQGSLGTVVFLSVSAVQEGTLEGGWNGCWASIHLL